MTDLLEDFETKKEAIRDEVELHIKKRDEANAEAQKYARIRDELNQKTHEMREHAKEKIAEKNELIEKIKGLRDEKEVHYKALSELKKQLREYKAKLGTGIDLKDIRVKEKELQYLEKRQQTTELKKEEENKLIVDIRRLNNEIKKSKTLRDEELLKNDDIKNLTENINQERTTGEEYKKNIEEISTRISQLSDEINDELQKLDEVRKEADENHELFIKYSQESEAEHAAFIKTKTELKDMEKAIFSIRNKSRVTKRKEKESELQDRATELYEKFKAGEQLTTEDLLILQKAGFL
ncbi:phosphoserine phosphatase [Ferroplasma sp.]|uniref:coiled-coil protein n=1 Tax=Ferroplasma sp. TaxID=2591003 RepID=UPI00307F077A